MTKESLEKNTIFQETTLFLERLRKNEDYSLQEKSLVAAALELVQQRSDGQFHASGVPIIIHVLRLAQNLLPLKVDASVLILALLHELPHRDSSVKAQIKAKFGEEMSNLINDVRKLGALRSEDESSRLNDLNFVLETMSHDIRIVVVRLIHRLVDLENADSLSDLDRRILASEAAELFVPLAGRLGMHSLKNRLEDKCFQILAPDLYAKIEMLLKRTRREDEETLARVQTTVQKMLQNRNIDAVVGGRIKGVYSVYRKMIKRQIPFEKVYDKLAVRIIVSKIPECYNVLGLIHTRFLPIPGTFDDYIAQPKPNNYQGLHTAIFPIQGVSFKPVEIQIRTQKMDWDAEYGAAAYWRYKSDGFLAEQVDEQTKWLKSLISLREKLPSHSEFVKVLNASVFNDTIIVFDHLGKVIYLPLHATAQDFADYFKISTVNSKVKINGKSAEWTDSLKNGDMVELELHLN